MPPRRRQPRPGCWTAVSVAVCPALTSEGHKQPTSAAQVVLTEREEGGGLAWLQHNLSLNAALPGGRSTRARLPCAAHVRRQGMRGNPYVDRFHSALGRRGPCGDGGGVRLARLPRCELRQRHCGPGAARGGGSGGPAAPAGQRLVGPHHRQRPHLRGERRRQLSEGGPGRAGCRAGALMTCAVRACTRAPHDLGDSCGRPAPTRPPGPGAARAHAARRAHAGAVRPHAAPLRPPGPQGAACGRRMGPCETLHALCSTGWGKHVPAAEPSHAPTVHAPPRRMPHHPCPWPSSAGCGAGGRGPGGGRGARAGRALAAAQPAAADRAVPGDARGGAGHTAAASRMSDTAGRAESGVTLSAGAAAQRAEAGWHP
jgi:hypothetical protein